MQSQQEAEDSIFSNSSSSSNGRSPDPMVAAGHQALYSSFSSFCNITRQIIFRKSYISANTTTAGPTVGGAKPEAMSGAYFALGVIKPGHGHATASTMRPANRMARTN